MNRQQRRFMKRQKAQGQSYADVLAQQREAHEAVEKAARDATVKVDADIRTQRALWLSVISMAEAFGLGPKRIQRYFEVLQKNHEWLTALEADDDIVAYEKLRQRAEAVSGIHIEYLYEHEIEAAIAAARKEDPNE